MNTRNGIIFLDVDGVLNSERWFQSEEYKSRRAYFSELYKDAIQNAERSEEDRYKAMIELKETHIDPAPLAELNRILTTCDLSIVLSSTWRIADFTRDALAEAGIDNWKDRFLGCTRRSRGGECRGDEIADWVKENSYNGKFIALDDDSDMGPVMPHLIQTYWALGLTKKSADKVVDYFGKPATVET